MNINDLVRYWGRTRPHQAAVVFNDKTVTWGELDDLSDALARGLISRGVTPGDRIGLLMKNRIELAALMLATVKTGAICVPLNFRLIGRELASMVRDASPRVVVTEGALAHLLEEARVEFEFEIFATESRDHPSYDSLILDSGCAPRIAGRGDDPAFICYTSGTTGSQKGALLTHDSILAVAQRGAVQSGLTGRDKVLSAAPLVFTGGGISVFMDFVVYPGSTMILLDDFDAEKALDVMERYQVSAATAVPVIWERMASLPKFDTAKFAEFHFAGAGGAPVSPDLLKRFRERGMPLTGVYGMTEASGLVSSMRYEDALRYPDYAGIPLLGTQVRIGTAEEELEAGEVGEILIKGPHVMKGYWRNEAATEAALHGGWLHSGDLGLMNTEGMVKLVDRSKDMLISGGLNVYPAEIEKELLLVDGIGDLAVIGTPDEQWGEVPMVVCYTAADPAVVAARISAVSRANLARFKQPKYLVLSDEPLPRTFSGKLSKPALRAKYPATPGTAIDIKG